MISIVVAGLGQVIQAASEYSAANVKVKLATAGASTVVRTGSMIQTQDDWAHQMRETGFWSKRASASKSSERSSSKPSGVGLQAVAYGEATTGGKRKSITVDDSNDDGSGGGGNFSGNGTYRTVCVRLCDGSFTPVSFATTRDQFEADSKRCEASCLGQAKLYVYKNPGSNQDDMEDLDGTPYKKLPTAFLYKTKYDAQCKCRPHPWEETSLARHKVYALEVAKAKGNKNAALELAALNATMKLQEVVAASARLAEVRRIAEEKRAAAAKRASDAKAAAEAKKQAKAGKAEPKSVSAAPAKLPPFAAASSVRTRQSILVANPDVPARRTVKLPPQSILPDVKLVTVGAKTVALPAGLLPRNGNATSNQ